VVLPARAVDQLTVLRWLGARDTGRCDGFPTAGHVYTGEDFVRCLRREP
jgi:hypothetical protein